MAELCYSRNDEEFSFREFGDLLDDMASDDAATVGAVYYEADCEPLTPEFFTRPQAIDSLLSSMDDALYEEVGEVADTVFDDVPDEARQELCALLQGWVEKHVNVSGYWRIVGKTRRRELTAEDIGATP